MSTQDQVTLVIEAIVTSFLTKFPNGHHSVSKAFGGGYVLGFGLISDLNDVANRIRENDVMHLMFIISDKGEQLEVSGINTRLMVKPPIGSYLAMQSLKMGWRDFTTTKENTTKRFDKFFTSALVAVKEQASADNIYGQARIPAKYLPV
jgi:hypothetical protein